MRKKFYKRKRFWLIAILVLVTSLFILKPDEIPKYEYIKAGLGEIVQEVSVTGKVEPVLDVSLSFNKSGRLDYVGVEVGNHVREGQLLARLERGDTLAQLAGAIASFEAERAKLDELKKGTRAEELNVGEVKVTNADLALVDAKLNVRDKIIDASAKADDAIHNRVDQFIENPFTNFPELEFTLTNQELEDVIESERVLIEGVINLLVKLKNDESTIETLVHARDYLTQIDSFLVDVARGVNSLSPSSGLTQTTIDGYKADVSTARVSITTAISSVTSSKDNLETSQSALRLAKESLVLLKAGSAPEQIVAQESRVKQAEASVNNYQAELLKSSIYSPISGIVTAQDAKVGEVVSTGTVLIKVISDSKYQILINLPEADVAKVTVGNDVRVTLDAYRDGVEFQAVVSKIEPAETVIDGVSTYKTTLQFKEQDVRIKSGMTANADILTGEKEDVLIIPIRAVINRDSEKFVKILIDEKNGVLTEVEVTTGLRGSDGNIEILTGVSEGDFVVIGELDI